ncbi:DUF3180 domain-containing protein [Georgenia sp. 10Sc9-8]|uniref:DUF3180 domain-containing protein n=1 Tax=Georgenia halotolerans TaxID=3028317 RepID=A0ABT5TX24_9MICO|nr:DUF3180 domain-containing protein [Georgenia halotolerans]
MQRTRWQTLVVLAVLVGLGSAVVLRLLDAQGLAPVPVPALSGAGLAVLAVVLLVLGRSVRRMVSGEESRMTALGAARVAMLAKASALGGAALTGYFGAQLATALEHVAAPLPRAQAWASGGAVLACLLLVGAGLVVEWWCRLPPDDDDDDPDELVGDLS